MVHHGAESHVYTVVECMTQQEYSRIIIIHALRYLLMTQVARLYQPVACRGD